MEVTKLSDFLKQQGDTPQGKSVYQAFIDNFDENYNEKAFEKNENEKESIANAFEWAKTSEGEVFWRNLDNKWRRTNARSNDMLWLLDGKEPPQEADVEDELEERRRKEAVTPTEQTPILPIGTNQLLDTEETKELYDEVADKDSGCDQVDSKRKQIGGDHYAKHTIQPWDIIREYELDYFEGNALKYLLRQKDNRLEDLQKAAHYLEECIKNEQKRIDNENHTKRPNAKTTGMESISRGVDRCTRQYLRTQRQGYS